MAGPARQCSVGPPNHADFPLARTEARCDGHCGLRLLVHVRGEGHGFPRPPPPDAVSVRRGGNPVKNHVALAGHKSNPITGYILDRSLGGLAMSLGQEIKPGTVVAIRSAQVLEMTPWYDVEVMRCQKTGNDWLVSCRFVKTPPYSVLMSFG